MRCREIAILACQPWGKVTLFLMKRYGKVRVVRESYIELLRSIRAF